MSKRLKIELFIALFVFTGSLISLIVLVVIGHESYARHLAFPVAGSVLYITKRFSSYVPMFTKRYKDRIYEAYHEELKYAEFSVETEKMILKGLFYLDLEKPYKAIKKLEKAFAKCYNDKQKSMSVFFKGVCYKELKLYHKAIAEYEKALSFHGDYYKIYRALGWVYKELKETPKAKECMKKALELNVGDAIGYNNMAHEYLLQENYEEAIKYAQKAAQLKPALYEPHSIMILCYAHLRDLEKVKQHYDQLIVKGEPDISVIKEMVTKILYDLDPEEIFEEQPSQPSEI
ncbi:MAG: tetratricopeptide repeat protein [Clostridia bacterium]|nr:tetratricopeptide repeat protein [Clostridia bacterium]